MRLTINIDRDAAIRIIQVLTHSYGYRRKELKNILAEDGFDLDNMNAREQEEAVNNLSDSAIESFLENTEY